MGRLLRASLFAAVGALVIAAPAAASGAELVPVDGSCWQPFAPRAGNAPTGKVVKHDTGYTLTLQSDGRKHAYGGWRCHIEAIQSEGYYRVHAELVASGLAEMGELRESVGVQIRWRGDYGEAVAPTYVWDIRALKDRTGMYEFDRVLQAPPISRAVDVELVVQWTPTGRIEWRSISLQPDAAPAPRKVRVAAVWLRPRDSRVGADSVERFAQYIDRFAPDARPDVIVLGEMINRVGVPGEPDAQAEPIPGPTTERLARSARRYSSWIVFSIVERDGPDLFNTAVLLDRTGRIAGVYRKVQVPFEEVSRGIAPGSSFPVFTTDFGKVGLLVCHDASFPEAAREVTLNGAEIILMPISGGRQTLVHARAMENGVYLVTSGYTYPSEIIAPTGDVLAATPINQGPAVALAEIDLSARFRQDWIGDWNDSYQRQQRPSAYRRQQPER